MPRSKRNPDDPDALTQYVGGMVSLRDLQMVERVMRRYGMSKANALRLLLRSGAKHHDPSPPSKEHTK